MLELALERYESQGDSCGYKHRSSTALIKAAAGLARMFRG